jgi:hypothetical protein
VQVKPVGIDLRHAGLVCELEAAVSVVALQLAGVAARARRRRRHGLAVGAAKAQATPAGAFDPIAALVHEPVVVGAEPDEVGHVRAAAAGPVV